METKQRGRARAVDVFSPWVVEEYESFSADELLRPDRENILSRQRSRLQRIESPQVDLIATRPHYGRPALLVRVSLVRMQMWQALHGRVNSLACRKCLDFVYEWLYRKDWR